MSAETIYAPNVPAVYRDYPSIFLAGSIEMGAAEDWQTQLTAHVGDLPIRIFNPRRPDWCSSWTQTKDNPPFRQQVEWEITHLARAHLIPLYLDPATKSPVSLLELGLQANTGKLIVCCPPGYWRKGNVDIVCERWGIPVYDDYDSFAPAVRAAIQTRLLP